MTADEEKKETPTVEMEPETKPKEKAEGKKEEKHKKSSFEEKEKEYLLQIEELKGQCDSLKNDYAKAYADTENIRKRMNADFDQKNKYRIQDFALEILPVLDNCDRALGQKTQDEAYRKGVQMIYDQLIQALKKEGVEEIDALNQPFDPNWHQALMSEKKEGVEPGQVIEVLQKGYKLKDRLLRATMVKVSE